MIGEVVSKSGYTNSNGALCFDGIVSTQQVPVYTDPSVNDFSSYAGTYTYYTTEGSEYAYVGNGRLGSERAVNIIVNGYQIYMQPVYEDGTLGAKELMVWDGTDDGIIWLEPISSEREMGNTRTEYRFENGMFFIGKRSVYDYYKR